MNKKMVTLILVILISFCFIGIVVAHNTTHADKNSSDYGKTIDNKTPDKNITPDKNDSHNKSKKNYILAQGSGNDIRFSDGYRGFILDYSKPPAKTGDEFKRASTSKASNSNTLKLAVIECYRQDSSGQIGQIMADFVKTGSSSSKVGQAVAASHESVGDYAVVKINDKTEAVFNFEVLESVSGNESDYFAYTVSYRSINNQTKNLTNITNVTNITNATNITNITGLFDNETNETLLYALLLLLADMLFDAWEPIIETLINDFLMFINALEEMAKMFENIMAEIQSMMDALQQFLNMLDSIWKELDGLLKLLDIILHAIQQLIALIVSILNYIMALISAIIALIQQILNLLLALINFLMDLINQIIALVQAILDFLKSVGSFLVKVIENAVIIIGTFVIITVAAFVYNRIRSS